MPRQVRQISKSQIYHVITRGNERRNIFLDDEDKKRFMDILCEKKRDKEYVLYAFCLMDNHVHLIIREGTDTISRIMKRINTGYAYYFNKKYKRVGHVFQDRFKSEAIESEAYLLAAIRYIHNNPVKANMIRYASQYPWSSYPLYLSENKMADNIIKRDDILGIFSRKTKEAKKVFIAFMNEKTEDAFMDVKEENDAEAMLSEDNVHNFIEKYLKENNQVMASLHNAQNVDLRNELIIKIKENSNLSIRTLARILGVDRGVVQRIYKKHKG